MDVNKKTQRNRFTRMCIGEAIVELMKRDSLDKITVSQIAKKAGISRMTYYHYYDSKVNAIEDYLREIIIQYLTEHKKRPKGERFMEYSHILFSIEFFDQYATFFIIMERQGLYSVLVNAVNHFMVELYSDHKDMIYRAYYYAGALLNTFINWEKTGKLVPAQEVAKIISESAPQMP